MKRQRNRKSVDPKPIIFYRPAWTIGIHTHTTPHDCTPLAIPSIPVETAEIA